MNLVTKGQSAPISAPGEDLKGGLNVQMTWSSKMDFDLQCLYETQKGEKGIVYFGNRVEKSLEALGNAPFIYLSKDAGVGDTAGASGNVESLTIGQLDPNIRKWCLVCSDYGAITKGGQKARFKDSDVAVKISRADGGGDINVKLDAGDMGNVVCIATIEQGPTGAKITNSSHVGALKAWGSLDELFAAVGA